MAEKTDLNVAPYYDDFNETNNFVKTLFRPGYAVQARELTQLQSALQNQVEKHGSHVFKEGAMVIPGQISINKNYHSLKLLTLYGSEVIDPSQYYNPTTPVVITGGTSGVTAQVIGYDAATTTDQPTLYLNYLNSGTDGGIHIFADGENISADVGITHNSSYSANVASATCYTSQYSPDSSQTSSLKGPEGPASRVGSAVTIEVGVYYVRGFFLSCEKETIVLDKYSNVPSYRVGFSITEGLITPETDSTLLDNATGTPNFAAKGAHRLKYTLALAKLARNSTDDSDFIQLMDVKAGEIQSMVRNTEYSVMADTLARRTFDESGNYTVRPFQYRTLESVDHNDDLGVYTDGATTDDGNIASSDYLVLKISPGKAYVGGYEIDKIGPTFKDIKKSRDFATVNAGVSTFDMGNYVLIENIYGSPDISPITGETTAYKTIQLYDQKIATRGSANGTQVGVARGRAIEYSSGAPGATSSNNDSQYKLFLMDIKPFTRLELSGTPATSLLTNHATGGVQVTDATSGATGLVHADGTSGNILNITNVTGVFSPGSNLTASDRAGNIGVTIVAKRTATIKDLRSVFMNDPDTAQDFTADIVLQSLTGTGEDVLVLDGTDSNSANINDNVLLDASAANTDEFGEIRLESQRIARLKDAEKNSSLEALPKGAIKTLLTATNNGLTDTQYTVRKQFIGTTNSSSVISFSAGANETFASHAEKDYTLSVLTAGSGTAVVGDLVSIASTMSGAGTATVTITDATVLGTSCKVKLTATILKTSVSHKIKTTQLMKQVKVTTGTSDAYGTRPTDATISLGRADVFKLAAVYDSEATGTAAAAPTLTTGATTGTFTRGEVISGSSSGSTGRLITTSSPFQHTVISGGNFDAGDTITGASSGATAVISTDGVTEGSKVLTSNYSLDTGQRDNYYDIVRIVRKPSVAKPTGQLLIVYDYLEHGSGDLLTVDSYVDIANRMSYDDITVYAATKVDPDDPRPAAEFPLADTLDFRPRVEDIAGTSATLATVDEITGNSFDFYSRQFDGSGASVVDFPKPGSTIQCDFEHYLSKMVNVAMDVTGNIIITEGISSERPKLPVQPKETMGLCSLKVPAFTFNSQNCIVNKEKNQRFTMRDIGKIEDRIDRIEYLTALSLLERSTENFEIKDANGLNRFKTGFIVDNFSGHRVGDVAHKDYKVSMDIENGEARPIHKSNGIFLEEEATTDGARVSAGYMKTGDLITMAYTEEVFTEQPYATRIESVTPFLTASWLGRLELNPSSDEWFETEIAPELIVNVMGNFDAVTAAEQNNIGTIWGAWETQWTGQTSVSNRFGAGWIPMLGDASAGETQIRDPNFMLWPPANWSGVEGRGGRWTRTVTTRTGTTSRSGVRTSVNEFTERESQGFKVINRGLVPFMRSRAIVFTGHAFRPKTRLYGFFDKTPVSAYCTPGGTTYTSDTTIVEGSPIITDAIGKIEGTFTIPDPKLAGNPKFETGELQFRLTSSSTNALDFAGDTNAIADSVHTAGDVIYTAKGILETEQETIIATRNATVTRETFNQSEPATDTQTSERGLPRDPLAQTFKIQVDDTKVSGKFITSLDLYFFEKDDSFPVEVEIRNVVNGYPGPKVLPFGRVVKLPADVNLSTDASTATTFTFPSPVYVKAGIEYCVCVITVVPTWRCFISRMGETDLGGSRTVSDQPHLGILFKSHNNSGWAMSPTEDLKFTIRTAVFDTSGTGTVTLQNKTLPAKTLKQNPLIITDASTVVEVRHRDHGMYGTINNVTLDKVKSGAVTTLATALGSTDTTLTLTSGGNFDDTSGKYSICANSLYYIKIDDEVISYSTIVGESVSGVTRAVDSTTAATHAVGATVELYQIHKVPLTEINKTHIAIANIGIDNYTLTLSTTPVVDGAGGSSEIGGLVATATENNMMDTMHTIIGSMEVPSTKITGEVKTTTGTSPDGTQTAFTVTDAIKIPVNETVIFDKPYMVCSGINETNELAGVKSFKMPLKLSTTSSSVSPVIDLARTTLVAISNRINNIDSSSDVYPTTNYKASTEPEGDNNAAIYLTKQITLENPAASLKVLFAAVRSSTSDIKVLYKILRTDDSSDFDDLGYTFFNSTGVPDATISPSLGDSDYREYEYTAGTSEEGTGEPLDEFIGFQIKIVMQGTNSARPPRLKDFRAIAMVN